jgi:hypothetical protein
MTTVIVYPQIDDCDVFSYDLSKFPLPRIGEDMFCEKKVIYFHKPERSYTIDVLLRVVSIEHSYRTDTIYVTCTAIDHTK